ncbi:unnamed protein product, partial [Laminaria digitata]
LKRSEREGAAREGGEGGSHPVILVGDGVDRLDRLDGVASGAPLTDRDDQDAPPMSRGGGESCDEGASTEILSERVVVPTCTMAQEGNPRSSGETHNPPPGVHIPSSSDETRDPPAEQTPSSPNGLPTAPMETATGISQLPTGSALRESDPTREEYDA